MSRSPAALSLLALALALPSSAARADEERSLEELIAVAGDDDALYGRRALYLRRLAARGPEAARAAPVAAEGLDHSHQEVRWSAALALGAFGDAGVEAVLAARLTDGEASARFAAAIALAQLGLRPAALADAAEDPDPAVAAAAAHARGEAGSSLLEALRAGLAHPEEDEVRAAAAAFLGTVEEAASRAGAEALVAALAAEQEYMSAVPSLAAESLARIGEPAIDVLADALSHDEEEVRFRAAWALAHTDADAADALDALLAQLDAGGRVETFSPRCSTIVAPPV